MKEKDYKKFLKTDKPVLIEFSAPWCVYCQRLAPVLDEVSKKYENTISFGMVNIDEQAGLAELEKIEVLPTLLLYLDGKVLGSIIAPKSKNQLEDFIKTSLQKEQGQEKFDNTIYDMIVIGGGPGGYTAALYAARAGLKTIVFEKLSAGGQMALAEQIDNYPGFENGINGITLGKKMKETAERFGVLSETTEVMSVDLSENLKKIKTIDTTIYSKTLVIATGAVPRALGIKNEKEYIGKGISYCASCDGMFYRNKTVVVVGGGNSAVEDALILSRICKKVILVHRKNSLRATKIYQDLLMQKENVSFYWNNTVTELLTDKKVCGIVLQNLNSNESTTIECDGVFISIGRVPATELVKNKLSTDLSDYIIADESTCTSIPGVYAVGDVRTKAVRQVVTAVSDGANAVHYAEKYLANTEF